MSSSRRWLLISSILLGILVIITVSLVLINRNGKVTLLAEDIPQGVVQRFLLAVKDGDLQKAYNYLNLSKSGKITSYDEWYRSLYLSSRSSQSAWKATLEKTTQNDYSATVNVTFDIFYTDNVNSYKRTFILTKINGTWFITTLPSLYWIY